MRKFLKWQSWMTDVFPLSHLIDVTANFCVIIQDVCCLPVLSLHVLAIWSLCSKLEIWSFKQELVWLSSWFWNCKSNNIICGVLIGNFLFNLLMDLAWDLVLYNWRCPHYRFMFSCVSSWTRCHDPWILIAGFTFLLYFF